MTVLKGEGKVPILFGTTTMVVSPRTHRGYLARPDLAGEWPTVVVVPAGDVTSATKDLCRRLARWGLAAVAPQEGARLDDIVSFVQNPAGFWSSAEFGFGVLGVNEGGGRAVRLAGDLGASALALAAAPLDDEVRALLAASTVPLLGIFARDDEVVPVAAATEARAAISHAELVIYDGVGHRFLDDSTDDFDFAVGVDAVERLARFFTKHLPPAPPV